MTNSRCDLTSLEFPLSYFQDEEREGFYISTMMKRYFASQLKVLSLVAQICEKYNIAWYADCGTLIGAVRHGGFVPWDDDLDICMLRDDWERFFDVAAKELPEGFQVLTIDREPEYEQLIGRIVNAHSIDIGPERMRDFFGCPYTVGIDIFPLDGLYTDEDKEKGRRIRGQKAVEDYTKAGGKITVGGGSRGPSGGKPRRLLEKVQEIYRECPTKDAEKVALMPFYISNNNHIYPEELFKDIVKLPFENTYINVPARYEEVLKIEYGDFMKLVKKGGIHEYPVYGEQEEMLRKHLGKNPFRYTLNPKQLLGSVQRYVLRQAGQMKVTSGQAAKKQAVFLPVRACWWKTMEPLWKAYSHNPEYEVHVLPIFYYDCDYTGAVDTDHRHDERSLFPEYVHVEDCEKYDFASIHPEVIVTQLPYDGNNTAITVHDFFYSANLLNFTDELVYVPYLEMDAPVEEGDKASAAIKVFVEQEGVINADRIVVSSEKMAEFYVNALVTMTGKDTENYWKQKVVTLDTEVARLEGGDTATVHQAGLSECNQSYIPTCTTDSIAASNKSWEKLLGTQHGKKVMIYHISISFILQHREKALEKIRRSMDTFREASDKICAILVPQEAILTDLERIDPELWRNYCEIVDSGGASKNSTDAGADESASDNIIYDPAAISFEHIDKWSGYYGDAASVILECISRKIPVMIENVEI